MIVVGIAFDHMWRGQRCHTGHERDVTAEYALDCQTPLGELRGKLFARQHALQFGGQGGAADEFNPPLHGGIDLLPWPAAPQQTR